MELSKKIIPRKRTKMRGEHSAISSTREDLFLAPGARATSSSDLAGAGSEERELYARELRLEQKEERLRARERKEREHRMALEQREHAALFSTGLMNTAPVGGDPLFDPHHPQHLAARELEEERARLWEHERCRIQAEQERIRIEEEFLRGGAEYVHATRAYTGGMSTRDVEVMRERIFPPRSTTQQQHVVNHTAGSYLPAGAHGNAPYFPPSSSLLGLGAPAHLVERSLRPARLEHEDLIKVPAIGLEGDSIQSCEGGAPPGAAAGESKHMEQNTAGGVSGLLSTLSTHIHKLTDYATGSSTQTNAAASGSGGEEGNQALEGSEVVEEGGKKGRRKPNEGLEKGATEDGASMKDEDVLGSSSSSAPTSLSQNALFSHGSLFDAKEQKIFLPSEPSAASSKDETPRGECEDGETSTEAPVEEAGSKIDLQEHEGLARPVFVRRLSCATFHSMEEYESPSNAWSMSGCHTPNAANSVQPCEKTTVTPLSSNVERIMTPGGGECSSAEGTPRPKRQHVPPFQRSVRRRLLSDTKLFRREREPALSDDKEAPLLFPTGGPGMEEEERKSDEDGIGQQRSTGEETGAMTMECGDEQQERGDTRRDEEDKEESEDTVGRGGPSPIPTVAHGRVNAIGPALNSGYPFSPSPPPTPYVGHACSGAHFNAPFPCSPAPFSTCIGGGMWTPVTGHHVGLPYPPAVPTKGVLKGTVVSEPPPTTAYASSIHSVLLPLPHLPVPQTMPSDDLLPTMDTKTIHTQALFHTLSHCLKALTKAWSSEREKRKAMEHIDKHVKLLIKQGQSRILKSSGDDKVTPDDFRVLPRSTADEACVNPFQKLRERKRELEQEKAYLMSVEEREKETASTIRSELGEWEPSVKDVDTLQLGDEDKKSTARRVYEMERYINNILHALRAKEVELDRQAEKYVVTTVREEGA